MVNERVNTAGISKFAQVRFWLLPSPRHRQRRATGSCPACCWPAPTLAILTRTNTKPRSRPSLSAGIRTFVNLMEEDETNYAGEPFVPYQDWPATLPGRQCFRHAIRDLSAPTPAADDGDPGRHRQLAGAGSPVYVHCWGGVGRTGTVIGCWLLRHWPRRSDVLDVLMRLRQQDQERQHRMSPETGEQQKFLRDDGGKPTALGKRTDGVQQIPLRPGQHER